MMEPILISNVELSAQEFAFWVRVKETLGMITTYYDGEVHRGEKTEYLHPREKQIKLHRPPKQPVAFAVVDLYVDLQQAYDLRAYEDALDLMSSLKKLLSNIL